ncbi:MAG TPA: large-conductance mechanosensitive channel protein MscL [Paludibacteraceae bacterium]|nr:large-conductance mechanosensitive channel protein MscL [Paludibacteraceae bacterium]HQG68369.1 large-conductance mechanosensitive channel protein MscL [Paludibacteraceae bacterium]
MKLWKEFKEFAMRGSVIDLAIGVIIGSAFGKIVSSLVADVIMPPIGLLISGINFTDLKLVLKPAEMVNDVQTPAVTLNYGNFLQVAFDFLIVAFVIFLLIKGINNFLKKKEEKPVPEATAQPSKEEILLTEIRDILKKK